MPSPAVASVREEDRARLNELIERGKWTYPGDHPIAQLDGLRLGDCTVIALLGPKNNVGSRYWQAFLAGSDGRLADEPVALGLHNSGPFPAFNWIELTQYREQLQIGGEEIDLWAPGLEGQLFAALDSFVPPGGHIMVEYDSPTHRPTERILTLRYPPAASPLGYLMFEHIGVRSYRDWYISEGGREGPRKLQGFKPLNDEIAAEKTAALRSEIETLLNRGLGPEHGEWGRLARDLATRVRQHLL